MAYPIVILTFCSVLVLSFSCHAFKVDLIHRDSPLSPFHDPTKTHSQLVIDAARRSISRANRFRSVAAGGAESTIKSANGEYLMNIALGTPPVQIHGIADTGSDLIWAQCKPCINCYKQIEPLFDSSKSSTYRNIACGSTACSGLGDDKTSCGANRQCAYKYGYGDRSYTKGDLATDTIRVGPVALPTARFGCGRDNGGTYDGLWSGIVGLGGGPYSLVRQLGPASAGKFSYCLVPTNSTATSSLFFGPQGAVSGNGVVSTPLVKNLEPATYYYLTLEAISVGGRRVPFKTSVGNNKVNTDVEEGNIIIDSGTTLTLLPIVFYEDFVAEVKRAVAAAPVDDPTGTFSLCYDVGGGRNVVFPLITAHFKGADVVLKPSNTFASPRKGLMCLAMVSAFDLSIFGNLAQMDYLVGYDLEAGTVSFKPTDCTKA